MYPALHLLCVHIDYESTLVNDMHCIVCALGGAMPGTATVIYGFLPVGAGVVDVVVVVVVVSARVAMWVSNSGCSAWQGM